ncbi:MAG: hypothetical protein AYK19_07800 [Theionarchaea archaeon DG-70-1]|nr:MAG: hypothetical protein AYK19_07800 [Theionarchaea archaeon DG-70-1]
MTISRLEVRSFAFLEGDIISYLSPFKNVWVRKKKRGGTMEEVNQETERLSTDGTLSGDGGK